MLNLQICHHEIFIASNETNKLYQIINQYTTYVFSCHIGFSYNVRYSNTTSYLTSRHNHIKATETRNVEVNAKDVQQDSTCCISISLGFIFTVKRYRSLIHYKMLEIYSLKRYGLPWYKNYVMTILTTF